MTSRQSLPWNTTTKEDEVEWSIQQIAKLAGTTSRTLRHYHDIGLLAPSRIGTNGYRQYDEASLLRLQRILLLREMGLSLPQISDVLAREVSVPDALEKHLAWLRDERSRLARQIAAVESTITAVRGGEELMAENMFDGFDHTAYRDEVIERWGADAYATSDTWWRNKTAAEKAVFMQQVRDLNADWIRAAEAAGPVSGPEATAVARRHVEWLAGMPGTPRAKQDLRAYVLGLGEMYVADPRFGANYATSSGGTSGAEFVRDALRAYVEENL